MGQRQRSGGAGNVGEGGLVRELYLGETARGHRFRYTLLAFDAAILVFLVVGSFLERSRALEILDMVIGLALLADLAARLSISRRRFYDLVHPLGLADAVAIASFLAPVVGEGLGFLRVLRTLRLFRSYRTVRRLKRDFPLVRRNYDAVVAVVHLVVFLFVMTALVYETQRWRNPEIGNYADALYFTVTTLTTTGFGDITLPGTSGRLLSVVIMIIGVSLFLRLLQVLFRPRKVRHECSSCGLLRHDPDAVHCKHCGAVLHIPTEGAN